MFRRLVAVAMLVSFVAIATSGMMMFVIEKPSFTIQMHPVHKLFGLLLVVAAVCHMVLNAKPIKNHLKKRSGMVAAGVLTVALVALYGVAVNKKVPAELATQMDSAAAQAEERGER